MIMSIWASGAVWTRIKSAIGALSLDVIPVDVHVVETETRMLPKRVVLLVYRVCPASTARSKQYQLHCKPL
jgi:hypothetical protein